MTQCGDGQGLILLRQSKTDQTSEGVLLVLDIETTSAVKDWISLSRISDSFLLGGDHGQEVEKSYGPWADEPHF